MKRGAANKGGVMVSSDVDSFRNVLAVVYSSQAREVTRRSPPVIRSANRVIGELPTWADTLLLAS